MSAAPPPASNGSESRERTRRQPKPTGDVGLVDERGLAGKSMREFVLRDEAVGGEELVSDLRPTAHPGDGDEARGCVELVLHFALEDAKARTVVLGDEDCLTRGGEEVFE